MAMAIQSGDKMIPMATSKMGPANAIPKENNTLPRAAARAACVASMPPRFTWLWRSMAQPITPPSVKVSKDMKNLMYHGGLGSCCSTPINPKPWFLGPRGLESHGRHGSKHERKIPMIRAAMIAPVAPMAAAFALEVYPGTWALFRIAFPITLDDEGREYLY